ncbi:MAG: hypothetical protein L0Y57_12310, partial [Beijerinckiaceae bacterium]|nr:hypothetical protein [Beijerinckiaceae bacterium]
PLIPDMAGTFTSVSGAVKSGRESVAEWRNPLWTAGEIGRSMLALGPLMAIGLPAALSLIVAGCWDITRRRPVAVALFVANIPLTIALLLAFSFRIWPRYFLIDAGFAYIFLVRGVYVVAEFVARELKRRKLIYISGNTIGLCLSIAMAAASLLLVPRNYRYPKQDFAGAAAFVEAARAPGDAVASVGLARLAYGSYYAPAWAQPETDTELKALANASDRLWVVYAFPVHTRSVFPEILEDLEKNFDFIREFPGTLGDGYVHVYRSKPSARGAMGP